MSTPAARFEAFAQTAEHHAAELHGVDLRGANPLRLIDNILTRESQADPGDDLMSVALCYGIWIGELAVRELGAEWVALEEPVAPRLRIGDTIVSPIDAIERRLKDPNAPAIEAAYQTMRDLAARVTSDDTSTLRRNRAAWDDMADDRRFAKPAYGAIDSDSALDTLDTWVHKEAIAGQRVLCLGAGGGTHGPLFAAAGASVTVVDLSDRQLEHDRRYADEHGVDITAVQSSIDDLQALGDASFDIVIQPVCTCYVRDLAAVYHHVARVLQPGGLYLSQHKHPASMQADASPISSADTDTYRVARAYVEGVALPDAPGAAHREAGTVEYLHTLEALLGGLCRAGFVIEDVTEPVRADALAPPGDPAHRAVYLPPYLKIKARRRA